ncbi:MAG: hypothetical protein ACSHWU_12595 [Marinicella sp.]
MNMTTKTSFWLMTVCHLIKAIGPQDVIKLLGMNLKSPTNLLKEADDE